MRTAHHQLKLVATTGRLKPTNMRARHNRRMVGMSSPRDAMNIAQHEVLGQSWPRENRVPQGRLSFQLSLRDLPAKHAIQTQHCVRGYIQMPLRGT